jgi:hypothetical protein
MSSYLSLILHTKMTETIGQGPASKTRLEQNAVAQYPNKSYDELRRIAHTCGVNLDKIYKNYQRGKPALEYLRSKNSPIHHDCRSHSLF